MTRFALCTIRLVPFLLDFAEDDVHVSEGDVLAVNHGAVFAEFGPVLAVHLLAGGAGVTVNGKASKRLLQGGQLHRRGRAHSSIAGSIRISGKPFGRSIFRLVTMGP